MSPLSWIHQYHFSARPKDAVTNHMRLIRGVLRESGVRGNIYAHDIRPRGWSEIGVFRVSEISKDDFLLIHFSLGNPRLEEVLKAPCRKAIVYHNITPASFFKYDRHTWKLCELGRNQLWTLRKNVTDSFAVSKTNAFELKTLGFPRLQLLPLLDLSGEYFKKPTKKMSEPTLLFVGRLAPHKNQVLLIKVISSLRYFMDTPVNLVLVGRGDPVYTQYLRLLARTLGVGSQVTFRPVVEDSELNSLYRKCHLYVSLSEHEGFGVPLVDAIVRQLPVVALAIEGVKETLGKSGVQLKSRDPVEIAAVIATLLNKQSHMDAVVRGQRKRYRLLRKFQHKDVLRKILMEKAEH